MYRIPTLFRIRQSTHFRCIKTLARHRSQYTAPTLVFTEIDNKNDGLSSYPGVENETRQNNRGLSASKQNNGQDTSSQRPESKLPLPLGVRQNIAPGQDSEWDTISSWEHLIATNRQSHGDQGAWETFLELRSKGDVQFITDSRAVFLRDSIMKAALTHFDRMEEFFKFAKQLQETYRFKWPELYMKVVHFYLAQTDYETASLWHLKLMPAFRPDLDNFGTLLASFAIDFTPKLQSTLTRIYVFSPYRQLYDYVVPALFDTGQSHAARVWRKRFILFNDYPKSQKSMPFLDFLSRYFPTVQLTREELAVLNGDTNLGDAARVTAHGNIVSDRGRGIYRDKFAAQWFASSWPSSEFSINLMHRFGLRRIGPHSLQSIALKEDDARGVVDRLEQLRKLGMSIAPRVYSQALISFAERGEDDLLRDLLHCDIHPNEFQNQERRLMLLAASATQQNWGVERVLQEVEALVPTLGPSKDTIVSEELNKNLHIALLTRGLETVRTFLDRMDRVDVTIGRENAEALLDRVFEDIWYHPKLKRQKSHGYQKDPLLDRAIYLSLRVARQGAVVPIKYWQMLLYNLGRLGRFKELEGLSREICELYSPGPGGLIPVHWQDKPTRPKEKLKDLDDESETWSEYYSFPDGKKKTSHFKEAFWRAEMGLPQKETTDNNKSRNHSKKQNDPNYIFRIPADLPFTNRQHPIQNIFDISLQRAIIRWGFDKTLAQQPAQPTLMTMKATGIEDYDLACGVRLLAMLRDKGVYIDQQVVRSAVIKRLAVANLPGRARARARDDRELSPANMKQLVEKAWGSTILPSEAQLATEIENQRPKLWKNYPRLFQRRYDDKEADEKNTSSISYVSRDQTRN